MSGSTTSGVNAATTAPATAATTPATGTAGLINTGPLPAAPATPTAASYTPTNATATGYTPTNVNVGSNQTVAGQISNIIASGSPLYAASDQPTRNGDNDLNQRGLIDLLQPGDYRRIKGRSTLRGRLANRKADANTYNQAATANAAAANTQASQLATAQNTASQFNAGAANTMNAQTAAA